RSLATRVPAPRFLTTRPLLDRYWNAARTVGRDRPSRSASCTSFSSRAPTFSAPDLIAASKCWASWKYRGTGLVRSMVIRVGLTAGLSAVWCSCIRLAIRLPSGLQDRARSGKGSAGIEGCLFEHYIGGVPPPCLGPWAAPLSRAELSLSRHTDSILTGQIAQCRLDTDHRRAGG